LQRESTDKEMHEDNVSFRACWVGACRGRKSMYCDKSCMNIVQEVGPDLANILDGKEGAVIDQLCDRDRKLTMNLIEGLET